MSGGGESVKVAVRVRPFNSREKERGSTCCVEMNGITTRIKNPEAPKEEPKAFSFDFSYWSHDGFEDDDGVLIGKTDKYATQRKVFEDLGQGVLDNAFEGYNCSLFAYGQTGAGKSYSMIGYGKNKGIVPITCDELFKSIGRASGEVKYEVTFSMLEIYNEQVRDLLQKNNPKGGLTVRQNPKLGLFYVEKLKKVAVESYEEIERRSEEGTANRTVASTQMNATSSRAHTVITITFDQISKNDAGEETKKSSSINLVDLAGSERAESTGATGDRLKEGANINKSLSALGNVISALADLSMGKKKVVVPYRDSVLTKLLMNALGGNSKTIMIAALSPADINYDETLGTLRYADRAKKIKNKAVVNENPMDKLIRELKEENERLKKQAAGMPVISGDAGMSQEDIDKMKAQMEEEIRAQLLANQEMMKDMDWEAKRVESKKEDDDLKEAAKESDDPYFENLNEDPMLCGKVKLPLKKDAETTIGRKDADPKPDIILSGLSIQKNHATVAYNEEEIIIKPVAAGARIKVNGFPLTGERKLEHNDRVIFGSNHLYVFKNPLKPELPEDTPEEIDWDFAQKELAEQSGFATQQDGMTKDQQRAQEQILELLPMINEMNAVSEELNKYRKFDLVLMSGIQQEDSDKSTKVMVKVNNLLNNNVWMWERGKFMNRRYIIQELYQQYIDGDDSYKELEDDKDPFFDPPEDLMVGSANVFLQSLSYALDFEDKLVITDYKGQEEGTLDVAVAPCDEKGNPIDEDSFVEEPSELMNKPYYFKVHIRSCELHNSTHSKGIYVKYKTIGDEKAVSSEVIKDTLSPVFDSSRVITIPSVNEEHLEFFETKSITFSVYAMQENTAAAANMSKLTTKEISAMGGMSSDSMIKPSPFQRGQRGRRGSVLLTAASSSAAQSADGQMKAELNTIKKKYERLEKKEKRIQAICNEWQQRSSQMSEQEAESFYNSIRAVAFSSGIKKLQQRVRMMNQRDSDAFSIYSFEMTSDMKFISNFSPHDGAIMEEEEEEEENEVNRTSNGDAALPTIVLPNQVADSNSTTNKSDVAANPKAAADTPTKPAAASTPKGATIESPKSKKNKSPSPSTKRDKKLANAAKANGTGGAASPNGKTNEPSKSCNVM